MLATAVGSLVRWLFYERTEHLHGIDSQKRSHLLVLRSECPRLENARVMRARRSDGGMTPNIAGEVFLPENDL